MNQRLRRRLLIAAVMVAIAALSSAALVTLGRGGQQRTSALIGKPAPIVSLDRFDAAAVVRAVSQGTPGAQRLR
jgi:hypothetical protein